MQFAHTRRQEIQRVLGRYPSLARRDVEKIMVDNKACCISEAEMQGLVQNRLKVFESARGLLKVSAMTVI